MRRYAAVLILAFVLVSLIPGTAQAYIGPGAGFALAGSVLAVLAAILMAIAMVLSWPFRLIARLILRRRAPANARCRRVVILGIDGLDFGLTERMLAEGKLPHLAALREQGCLRPLASTLPPISPVAWSTFQTGVNPGKHGIFDHLVPDRRTYRPKPSSVEIGAPRRRVRVGRLEFPIGPPQIRLLRKSQPFWSVLGRYGIFNCIIRVPVTFPPEKLHGVQLSGACVPDLRGTQGTFSHYTTRPATAPRRTDADVQVVTLAGDVVRGELLGPPHPSRPDRGPLVCPFVVTLKGDGRAALRVDGATYPLSCGEHTEWIRVRFRIGAGSSVTGVCRFLLLSGRPDFDLYVTPIHIDPERPAMPIGYPAAYPIYLAKRCGAYGTLGLAEDTCGLGEQVLREDDFLRQCVDSDREREAMLFDALDNVSRGLCVCVFDAADRTQHMFWRYLDPEHPARPQGGAENRNAVEEAYRRMDDLVGRTAARCSDPGTLLMVLSDHGFTSFRRGVDLNRWLEEEGYLKVDDARRNVRHLEGVDWSVTRAFAIGLSGIFLNVRDRFSRGIVEPGAEADALRSEIARKLANLTDPQTGRKAVRRVYESPAAYRGPYRDQAPDLIVGYESGYRVSWEAAAGETSTAVFHENLKAWSGDHCVDPSIVPGVLFCNRAISTERPRLLDIAPTVLDLFGIPKPDYMDGRPLVFDEHAAAPAAAMMSVAEVPA